MSDMWETPLDDQQAPATFTRPTNPQAERVLLGSAMQRPELTDELADTFDPDDLSVQAHRWIWDAIVDLRNDIPEGPINFIAIDGRIQAWKAAGRITGPVLDAVRISQLWDEGFPAAAAHYAEIVTRTAEASRFIDLGIRAQQMGMARDFDRDAAVTAVQDDLDNVVRSEARNAPALVGDLLLDAIERAVTPRTTEDRVPTGLKDLDDLMGGGFAPGRLIIIGARPGVGKTTIGQGFARAAAIGNNLPTLFTSLEMGRDELTSGILSAETTVAYHHITHGTVDDAGAYKLTLATERIAAAPLYIDDATHVSLPSLRAQVRHLVRTAGLRMVIVDYLQLMQAPKAESRQVAVAALSRGLKLMAKEFGIVVVVLSQLNRASEQRSDRRPTISDLRESGAIEQDADMVILVHRPDMHEPESPRAGEVDLIVDKHRGGHRTTITAAWQGHYARLFDMARTPHNPFAQGEAAA